MRVNVLMVAEKPSIAATVANALSGGDFDSQRGGMPVHEYEGDFRGFPARFLVTSVAGHIFSTDFPPEYQNRETVDPVTLFAAPVVKKAEKGSMVRHIQQCAAGAHFIVLWLDCDREGENICFEVLQLARPRMAPPPAGTV